MQLDWNGFEISHATNMTCISHVGVKFVDPGMPMFKYASFMSLLIIIINLFLEIQIILFNCVFESFRQRK